MKQRGKRLLSLALAFVMVLGLLPAQALAAYEGMSLKEELTALYGQEGAEYYTFLEENKLLKEDELITDAEIEYNGNSYSAEEMRALLEEKSPAEEETVSISGTQLTIAQLTTLLDTQAAIQAAREEYEGWSDEQKSSYADFLESLNQGEVEILSEERASNGLPPSGVAHNARLKVTADNLSFGVINISNAAANLSLSVSLTSQSNSPVSLSYKTLDGSARAGVNFTEASGNISVSDSTTIPISILASTERWRGVRTFIVQLSITSNNALFEDDMDTMAVQVNIRNDSSYLTPAQWQSLVYTGWGSNNFRISFAMGGNSGSRGEGSSSGLVNGKSYYFLGPNEHQTSNSWKNHMNDNTCNLNIWRDIDEPAELKNAIFDGSISHVVANWEYSGDGEFTINAQNRDSEGIEADGSDSFLNNLNTKTDGYELTSQYKIIDPTRFPVGNDGSTSIAIRKQLTQENWDNIYIRSRGICFLDTTSPTITNLSAPGGNYKTGDIIPITLAFSESVRLNELTITINDSTTPLTAVTNGTDDTGAYATFLYPVGLGDSESTFKVTSVSSFQDVTGRTGTYNTTTELSGITIDALSMRHAVDSISFDPDDIICEASAEDKTITLTVELNETLAGHFRGHITSGKSDLLAAYVDRKPGDTSPPSYALSSTDANPNTFTATIPVEKNRTGKDVTHYVELYFLKDVNKSNNGGVDVKKDQVYFGKVASYTVKPVQFLTANDFSINYINFPDEGSTIYANEAPSMTLGVNVTNENATYTTTDQFEWTSSNDNIATISNKKDTWGQISLGSGTGEVSFTLKALNGDEEDEAHHPTITSRSFTVQVGDNPYLNATPNLTVRRGQPVTVQWITNLMYKWDALTPGKETEFTVTVYKDENGTKGEQIATYPVKASKENPISRFTFPKDLNLSSSIENAWIVEVSAPEPPSGTSNKTASIKISVDANPAVVRLDKSASPFLTDSQPLTVKWTVEEMELSDVGDPTFLVTVRNSQTGKTWSSTKVGTQATDGTITGSYTINDLPPVSTGHRDIYTVDVTASNRANESPSFDAATFYVYGSNALSIWTDEKEPVNSLTMSNEDKIKKMIGTGDVTGQQNVLDLNRNISLTEGLSINQDKDWGSVSDQIIWGSSDESTATLNYRQGYSYQNIKDYSRLSFGPTANFLLSGLGSGETAVTATHAQLQEKLQATLNVQVNTLADKLYLFQLYPATETTLTYQYKDEKGQVKQGVTTSTGSGGAAIYAPGGIVGDVYCKSTNNNTVYVGTIYHDALLSGERDSTKLELYPMNTFSLRQVAVADFYLKQPNSNPFEGDVTVHAGVYKNGTYCENALFGTTAGNVHTSGVDGLK